MALVSRSDFEEALMTLMWAGGMLVRPTLANLTESFEGWQWRYGLRRSLARAERRGWLQRTERGSAIVYRLTNLGKLAAMGGTDLPARWRRRWDGRWRQVLFDLPAQRRQVRMKFWRWLRQNGFGYLQNSVWIHPDPIEEVIDALTEFREDVETFLLMEASCSRGYSNEAIVAGAWDFDEISKRHRAYISAAALSARAAARLRDSPSALKAWLTRERVAWEHAIEIDPILPRVLSPADYAGERAWETRLQSYRELAGLLLR